METEQSILFWVFLIYVLVVKCEYLFSFLPGNIAFAGCIIIIVFTAFVIWKRKTLYAYFKKLPILTNRYSEVLLFIFCLALKCLAILFFNIQSVASHPDIQVYVETAHELVNCGHAIKHGAYCLTFSHMFWFAVFLIPAILLGGSQAALSSYLACVSAITMIFVVKIVKRKTSTNRAILTGVALSILPSQILVNQYITHEIAALLFMVIAVWLYFCILPSVTNNVKKTLTYILFSILLLFSCLVNPAGIVMIIAFLMMFFIEKGNDNFKKRIIIGVKKSVVLLVIVIIGTTVARGYQIDHSIVSQNHTDSEKITWTLFVGANEETGGRWSSEDVERYSDFPVESDYNQIKEFRRELLLERYKRLKEDPAKLFRLVKEKSTTIWSCFTYPILYTNETIENESLQRFYNKYLDRPFVAIEYFTSLGALIWCFAGLLERKKRQDMDLLLVTRLFLYGMTMMLLLTECNNKYILTMQPFFILLTVIIWPISTERAYVRNK